MKTRLIKYKIAVIAGFLLMTVTSCNDWLDVKPKTEIDASTLFSDEDGFKEALAGVYTGMTAQTLYGRDMTYGMIDAMGQYWNITSTYHEFFYLLTYAYTEKSTQLKVDSVWNNMYNVIANVNSILDNIDEKRDVFRGDNYEIIKGEALALRAYLHFDLLRLFAPADFSTGAAAAIPYVSSLSKSVTGLSTPKQIIDYVLTDLNVAAELLKIDPVITGREITTEVDKGYLLNRNYHLNYYAVKGLLARVYLYAGNPAEAFKAADEVIKAHEQDGLFPWVKRDDITISETALIDRTFSSEHLFALNIRKLVDYIKPYFKATNSNLVTKTPTTTIYEGMADYRKDYLFSRYGTQEDVPCKLWQEDPVGQKKPQRDRMPLLRLSEIYYIAAECSKANARTAVDYLNAVRRHRGISVDLDYNVLSADDIQNEIYKEYRKEFICEGQLYYYHKRRGDAMISNVKVNYVFPKPVAEEDYGNRN